VSVIQSTYWHCHSTCLLWASCGARRDTVTNTRLLWVSQKHVDIVAICVYCQRHTKHVLTLSEYVFIVLQKHVLTLSQYVFIVNVIRSTWRRYSVAKNEVFKLKILCHNTYLVKDWKVQKAVLNAIIYKIVLFKATRHTKNKILEHENCRR
jgi:hypothetical protein